jgi:hypothetical protein
VSDDPLKRILQQADVAAGDPPEVAGDLARRVRALAARRRRVSFGLSVAAAVALAAGMTFLVSRAPTSSERGAGPGIVQSGQAPPDLAEIRAEIERLGREAEMRLAVARRTRELLEQTERSRALKRQHDYPDPVARARREVDRAAFVLVSQADRMCRDLDLCDSAAVKYQRVVDLFPETPWATVARQRLDEIKPKGDVS